MGLLKRAMKWLHRAGEETGFSTLGHLAGSVVMGGAKEGGKSLVNEILQQTTQSMKNVKERRNEFVGYLNGRLMTQDNGVAARALLRQLELRAGRMPRPYGDRREYLPGDEEVMIEACTDLKDAHSEPHELAACDKHFIDLGRLALDNPQRFDLWVNEILLNQPIRQRVRRIAALTKREAKKVVSKVKAELPEADDFIARELRGLNKWLGTKKGFRP